MLCVIMQAASVYADHNEESIKIVELVKDSSSNNAENNNNNNIIKNVCRCQQRCSGSYSLWA